MKNWSKFTLAIAFLAMYAMSAPSIWNGTADISWYESSAQAYNLTTAEQLAGLAQLVNDGTSDFSGKTITIGADIFLNDTTGASDGSWSKKSHRMWTPIGTQSTPFKGEFDGLAGKKNRKIYGLYINDTTKNYVGLFGNTSNVKISNIDLDVGFVKGKNYVGALIGFATLGSIANVYSKINVWGANYIGGIIGSSSGSLEDVSVSALVIGDSSVGGVIGVANASISYVTYSGEGVRGISGVGGIVGYTNSFVEHLRCEGNVVGSGDNIGGVIGRSYFAMEKTNITVMYDLRFVGSVSGKGNVGGCIGYDDTYDYGNHKKRILNLYSEGFVNGENYVGGLIGCTNSANSGYRNVLIDSSSHIDGDVVGTKSFVGGLIGASYNSTINHSFHENGNVRGADNVGGLCGITQDSIKNSYAKGYVFGEKDYVGGLSGRSSKIIDSSYHKGTTVGMNYVGGITGLTTGKIDNSYSEGNVKGSNYVGGIAGNAYVVLNSHAIGNVDGTMDYVGGLIGFSYYSCNGCSINAIEQSYHNGRVSGKNYVGGLVGFDSSYSGSGTGDAVRKGYINSYSKGNVYGNSYVGGILGLDKGFYNKLTINSCNHYDGNVVGDSNYVGGIAGMTYGKIISSNHTKGDVQGLDSVGGIAGYSGSVYNSYSMNKVLGRNAVGGLVGLASDSVKNSSFLGDSVVGVYQVGGLIGFASGAVDSSFSTTNVKGDDNVGGLIGSSRGNISNSFTLGNVIGDVDHSSAGNDNLGGLVGYVYSGSISKSLVKGNVSGTTKLGGLVGRFDGTSITQSYANGNVTGNYYGDPADEVGNFYIGGLVGYAKGSVSESYASGIVKGMAEDPVYTGCLIGYVDGSLTIDDSYFDNEKCSLGIEGKKGSKTAGATIANSSGKTTAEMQDEMAFANWDFANTWNILDDSYPFLLFFANSFVNADVSTASLKNMVYDGEAKTPAVTKVELGGIVLEENTDYQVSYQNNIDAGTASIKICGLGVYSGCKIIPFTIAPISLKITLGKIDNQVYDTFEKTPAVSIYEGESLMDDKSFSVEYANNINAGTASVRVSLTGNYSGSASTTFTIEKAKSIIEELPTAGEIFYGQILKKSSLEGGSANIEGSFVWSKTDIVPDPVNDGYEVKFVPKDAANYLGATGVVSLVVKKCVVSFTFEGAILQIDSLMYGDIPQFDGDLPKKNSVQFEYTFKTWSPKIVAATGNQTYVAVFDSTLRKYTINFYSGDSLLQSSEVKYGSTPTLKGSNPKKAMSESHSYTFKDWSPKVVSVTDNADYFAVFDSTIRTYTVSFMNGLTTLKTMTLEYGAIPNYSGTPSKANSEQYKYTFVGWSPAVEKVTGETVYKAIYDSVLQKYTIEFKANGKSLLSINYDYGSIPTYDGTVPTKSSTKEYSYSFVGWTPEISKVTGATSYTAKFDSTIRTYEITFISDGKTLQSKEVEYGTLPKFEGKDPSKKESKGYTYSFKGWKPSIAMVKEKATYTAVFDSVAKKFIVTFMNGKDTLQSSSVAYGKTPEYKGKTPTKSSSSKYEYKFAGWSPKLTTVTEKVVYKAVFDSTKLSGILPSRQVNSNILINVNSRNIQIYAAPVGKAYALFDMQGRVLQKGRIVSANYNIVAPRAGSYFMRIGNQISKVEVK